MFFLERVEVKSERIGTFGAVKGWIPSRPFGYDQAKYMLSEGCFAKTDRHDPCAVSVHIKANAHSADPITQYNTRETAGIVAQLWPVRV